MTIVMKANVNKPIIDQKVITLAFLLFICFAFLFIHIVFKLELKNPNSFLQSFQKNRRLYYTKKKSFKQDFLSIIFIMGYLFSPIIYEAAILMNSSRLMVSAAKVYSTPS